MATTRAIAQALGVSQSSVSRALAGKPGVSTDTRDRVKAYAESIGYTPNLAVASVMANRRRGAGDAGLPGETILYLSDQDQKVEEKRKLAPYETWKGIQDGARRFGLQVWRERSSGDQKRLQRLLRVASVRGVRGVVIGAGVRIPDDLTMLLAKFAVVKINDPDHLPELHHTEINYYRLVNTAFENVFRLGYRRPGFSVDAFPDSLSEGALAAVARGVLGQYDGAPPPLIQEEWNPEAIVDYVAKFRPDCVILRRSSEIDALRGAGIEIPGQCAVAKLFVAPSDREVSGVDVQSRQSADAAITLLYGCLVNATLGVPENAFRLTKDPIWVDGRTCPRAAVSDVGRSRPR